MKLLVKTTLIISMIIVLRASVWGAPSDFFNRSRGDEEWGLSFGVGQNYRIPEDTDVPFMEFNLFNIEYEKFLSPRTSIEYELSLADQVNIGSNKMISLSVNFTRYYLVRGRFSANYKLGLGVMQLKDKVPGQATTTNFNEQAGLGLQYAIGPNSAITFEATFYHASNAGFQHPNHGINATFIKLGYCWH